MLRIFARPNCGWNRSGSHSNMVSVEQRCAFSDIGKQEQQKMTLYSRLLKGTRSRTEDAHLPAVDWHRFVFLVTSYQRRDEHVKYFSRNISQSINFFFFLLLLASPLSFSRFQVTFKHLRFRREEYYLISRIFFLIFFWLCAFFYCVNSLIHRIKEDYEQLTFNSRWITGEFVK